MSLPTGFSSSISVSFGNFIFSKLTGLNDSLKSGRQSEYRLFCSKISGKSFAELLKIPSFVSS